MTGRLPDRLMGLLNSLLRYEHVGLRQLSTRKIRALFTISMPQRTLTLGVLWGILSVKKKIPVVKGGQNEGIKSRDIRFQGQAAGVSGRRARCGAGLGRTDHCRLQGDLDHQPAGRSED